MSDTSKAERTRGLARLLDPHFPRRDLTDQEAAEACQALYRLADIELAVPYAYMPHFFGDKYPLIDLAEPNKESLRLSLADCDVEYVAVPLYRLPEHKE